MFENYETVDKINESNKKGYLYILICFINGIKLSKFGETNQTLKERILNYNHKYIQLNTISGIYCDIPCKRERLIKGFLKYRTSYTPLQGVEYYSYEYYDFLKILLLIICSFEKEEIELYYNYYIDKNTNYNIIFDKIKDILNCIKNDSNFKIELKNYNVNEEIKQDKEIYICEFCNNSYTSVSSLNYHKKSTKFCIEIQKKNNILPIENINDFSCEFCEKKFVTKSSFGIHLMSCDVKKYKDKIDKEYSLFKKEVELKYKDYENQLLEYKIKLELKDEKLKKLEEINKKIADHLYYCNL